MPKKKTKLIYTVQRICLTIYNVTIYAKRIYPTNCIANIGAKRILPTVLEIKPFQPNDPRWIVVKIKLISRLLT